MFAFPLKDEDGLHYLAKFQTNDNSEIVLHPPPLLRGNIPFLASSPPPASEEGYCGKVLKGREVRISTSLLAWMDLGRFVG